MAGADPRPRPVGGESPTKPCRFTFAPHGIALEPSIAPIEAWNGMSLGERLVSVCRPLICIWRGLDDRSSVVRAEPENRPIAEWD